MLGNCAHQTKEAVILTRNEQANFTWRKLCLGNQLEKKRGTKFEVQSQSRIYIMLVAEGLSKANPKPSVSKPCLLNICTLCMHTDTSDSNHSTVFDVSHAAWHFSAFSHLLTQLSSACQNHACVQTQSNGRFPVSSN